MLTGRHPFDLNGDSSDKEVERRIKKPETYTPPLRGSDVTKHLSDSAIELIEQLLERDPNKRLTAIKMLEHPWVRGETATADIIAGSDTRLGKFRKYKSKLQAKFFQNAVDWSDIDDETARKTSLIERYFQSFDRKKQGVVTGSDLGQSLDGVGGAGALLQPGDGTSSDNTDEDAGPALSMSDFHSLLADSMQHRYFPKGCVVYREGEIGNAMYFINSGAVEVTTQDGTRATRRQGDFFGKNTTQLRFADTQINSYTILLLSLGRIYFCSLYRRRSIASSSKNSVSHHSLQDPCPCH
jgi:Cyclic nucleotide-binding domain/Protein kinase domain